MNTEDTRTTGLSVVVEKLRRSEEENQLLRGLAARALGYIESEPALDDEGIEIVHDLRAALHGKGQG